MSEIANAKTGAEMLDSWQTLVGNGDIDDIKEAFGIFAEKMPQILANFTQRPLAESLERNALDPKTRELVLLGILAAMNCGPGVVFHIQGAAHEGATEEEILETIFLSAYEHGKVNVASLGGSVKEGLKRASEKIWS